MLSLDQLISEATALPDAEKAMLIDKIVASMAVEIDEAVLLEGVKTAQERLAQIPPKQNFLLTVAGLGNSGQTDTSDRDEEILRNEIDPIHGWSSNPSNQ
jgi:hypothetical protein